MHEHEARAIEEVVLAGVGERYARQHVIDDEHWTRSPPQHVESAAPHREGDARVVRGEHAPQTDHGAIAARVGGENARIDGKLDAGDSTGGRDLCLTAYATDGRDGEYRCRD